MNNSLKNDNKEIYDAIYDEKYKTNIDYGCDIIIQHFDNSFTIIQCKNIKRNIKQGFKKEWENIFRVRDTIKKNGHKINEIIIITTDDYKKFSKIENYKKIAGNDNFRFINGNEFSKMANIIIFNYDEIIKLIEEIFQLDPNNENFNELFKYLLKKMFALMGINIMESMIIKICKKLCDVIYKHPIMCSLSMILIIIFVIEYINK